MIATGFALKLDEFAFDPNRPHRCCLICGDVFQPDAGFTDNVAEMLRSRWAQLHARKHPEHEHRALRVSGRFCTPVAAERLAAYGIFSLIDLCMDDEVKDALAGASAIPDERRLQVVL
jgi:hypothetical protein